ncbi:MAG: hypothetical protein H6937_10630 [Burkholderiales bacterium]|nr:hypothetical protein [Burkholderiales bacterium]MDR4516308.1 hypothetical protein [Nitrosomonas sp.]
MKTHQAIQESSSQLMKCKIKIKTREGKSLVYHGLFKSTTDAILDAINRFDIMTIFVKAM